jgi:porin
MNALNNAAMDFRWAFIGRVIAVTLILAATGARAESSSDSSADSRAPASVTEARPMGQAEQKTEEAKEEKETGLLGEWGGAKPYLSNHGIDVYAGYKFDMIRNFSGGVEQKGTVLGNFDVKTGFDLEKMGLVKGMKFHVYGIADHGNSASDFVGDSFATSNIEAPSGFRLFEAYLEQNVDEHFQVAVGLRDLNAIYDSSSTASEFLNGAFGVTPSLAHTGINGPSIFPFTSLSANAKYESPNSFYFQTGVFNALAGDPNHPHSTEINGSAREGYLMMYEAGFSKADGCKLAAGAWVYTKDQDRIDGNGTHQNGGYYVIADKKFSNLFSSFVKYGIAQPNVNVFRSTGEAGVTFTGLIPKREDDELGFGVAYGQASGDYKATVSSDSSETAYELFYKFEVMPGLKLIPDLQYIDNPGLDSSIKNAEVGTVRIEIEF